MNIDFRIHGFENLLAELISKDYKVYTFFEYTKSNYNGKVCILRHDIDRISKHIIKIASLERDKQLSASYYFPSKIVKRNPILIKEISNMGHEVGYHYNDLSYYYGDYEKAYHSLKQNLEILRSIAPVSTICMDGKPLQMMDNRKLWEEFNYKELGILGEIYLDVDYNSFAYYTDTGRKWNNKNINVRDKVITNKNWPVYSSTFEIINAINNSTFPEKVVINMHPEHWTDNSFDWFNKLIWQNSKNIVKYFLIKYRNFRSIK